MNECIFFDTVAFIMDSQGLINISVPVPDSLHFELEDYQEYGNYEIQYWGDNYNTLWSGWVRK